MNDEGWFVETTKLGFMIPFAIVLGLFVLPFFLVGLIARGILVLWNRKGE